MNIQDQFQLVKTAGEQLINVSQQQISQVLKDLSQNLLKQKSKIIKFNQQDLQQLNPENPMYDRLQLTAERIEAIANDIINVSKLKSMVGQTIEKRTLPNKLKLNKVAVPLGTIGIIYEARPNVTIDVFTLCFKTQNACILKGGSEARHSNEILVKIIQQVLKKHKINSNCIYLLPNDRELVAQMLKANEYIDVIIPRGSQNLINFVRQNASVPVIETGAGVVHTYIDETCDLDIAANVIWNSKTRRPSVCNSLDTIIIHKKQLKNLLKITEKLQQASVKIFADKLSFKMLEKKYPEELLQSAVNEDFGKEYLSLQLSIKTVKNLDEALEHIKKYSSKHSEAIVSKNNKNIERFMKHVDAAAVYANTSTAFTDGGQFGMGAEIGISTQKLHARGPMGLNELTTYKWLVISNGQIRT